MGVRRDAGGRNNREHPDHDTFAEWLGNRFDPEAFDVAAVNKVLRLIR
jgi:hypothetical protein